MKNKSIVNVNRVDSIAKQKKTATDIIQFINAGMTATNRSSFYNTINAQNDAVLQAHREMLNIDRGLYLAVSMLPGMTDYTKIMTIGTLLTDKTNRDITSRVLETNSTISLEIETAAINYLANTLPTHRFLNFILELKEGRINNSRVRHLILQSILNSQKFDWQSVKYRKKLREVLTHAWSLRTTSIIKSILSKKKNTWTATEAKIIVNNIDKYLIDTTKTPSHIVYDCVAFVLGIENGLTTTINTINSYISAKTDLDKGSLLPREVLEGIRSIYHKTRKSADVIQLTSQNMTNKEQMKVQQNAKKHNVTVSFDITKQSPIDIYIHAYANSLTDEMKTALSKKAKLIANTYPSNYDNIAIIIDASASMFGSDKQKYRPIAIAQTLRDVIATTTKKYTQYICSGREVDGLIHPEGDTDIATTLLDAIESGVDAIYVISDGYENAPAGRFEEVVNALEKIGCTTPIIHYNPVYSAEDKNTKQLAKSVNSIPASKPEALGMTSIINLLSSDFKTGIISLLNATIIKAIK